MEDIKITSLITYKRQTATKKLRKYVFCCNLHKSLLRESLKDVNDKINVLWAFYYSDDVIEKYKAQLSYQSSYKVTDAHLISYSTRPPI